MKKILFVAAEGLPFIKTGGLADVVGSLPKELKKLDNQVDVILPKYSAINSKYIKGAKFILDFNISLGWRNSFVGLWKKEVDGINYYFIENEYYFNRFNLYGDDDEGEKFSYFNKAVLESLKYINKNYDILHLHDWHTGMISLLLKDKYKNDPLYKDLKTVYTVHNLKYQGIYPENVLEELLEIDMEYFYNGSVEFHGNINFMKAGVEFSDIVTTVSESYANEITYDYYGEGLHGLFRKSRDKIVGVTNGIDKEKYNPKKDSDIHINYDMRGYKKKRKNKKNLQKKLNLKVSEDIPMIGIVSRLVENKGMDLILHILDDLLKNNVQIVLLGTGEWQYEKDFKWFDEVFENFHARIDFSEKFAKEIYAASDLFLMPSRFEPCGLGQQIAQSYGTVPIVRKTGGLADTVKNFNENELKGNGFVFNNYNAHELLNVINKSLSVYKNDKLWRILFKNCMKQENSWKKSAKKYDLVYEKLL